MSNSDTTIERRMLNTHEVAAALGISEGAVRLRIQDGEIHSTKVGGRRLIPVAEIDRIVRSAYLGCHSSDLVVPPKTSRTRRTDRWSTCRPHHE